MFHNSPNCLFLVGQVDGNTAIGLKSLRLWYCMYSTYPPPQTIFTDIRKIFSRISAKQFHGYPQNIFTDIRRCTHSLFGVYQISISSGAGRPYDHFQTLVLYVQYMPSFHGYPQNIFTDIRRCTHSLSCAKYVQG